MMSFTERDQLIDDLLDGIICPADHIRLEAEMLGDPAARRAYYDRLTLTTLLEETLDSPAIAPTKSAPHHSRRKRTWSRPLAAAAASIAILGSGIFGGWLAGTGSVPQDVATAPQPIPEPTASGFAIVTAQDNAVWKNALTTDHGDLLPSGALTLQSGRVQLDLLSGVTVIIEGEAEFEVLSPMEMAVSKGAIRAQVPDAAKGFRIHTSDGDVVDLGTEFALEVAHDRTDIRVIDGEIEWHAANEIRSLKGGEFLRTASTADAKTHPSHGTRPLAFDLVASQLRESRDQRNSTWHTTARANAATHPGQLLYFPFDQKTDSRRRAADFSPATHSGAVVRASRAEDRWGNPLGALDFTPTGSSVRVVIPGTHPALTLTCWVKIDSLDRHYNSLFLTDGHEVNEPHWQIMDDGRLFFSVLKAKTPTPGIPGKHIFYSPPIWTPADTGKWLHLTTVYDTAARNLIHYVNGEPISDEPIPEALLVDTIQIGAASIGNWSEPYRNDPQFAIRNLNGVIDDFALFSTALTPAEVAELYSIGKP